MNDSLTRFSNRVENYLKYRPRYPQEVIETLRTECGLLPASVVADVGSGTGMLTELFLCNGNLVFAVEPNREMREAAERLLAGYAGFRSVDGTAEATGLPTGSVDFMTAGQAFHWFDREKAKRESQRVLRSDGWVVLVWNDRLTDSTPFLAAYEQLLRRHATDYEAVNHRKIDKDVVAAFFAPHDFGFRHFPNRQVFDFQGLKGRLESSSYVPAPGQPGNEAMRIDLEDLFQIHQSNDTVTIEYLTLMYFGRLRPASR
ncbi:MAG: class I SAM-dependent methyltransferase [Candidatus Hydrogenedentes bacterium]|nr:class I SAM-dependent methyltransferase [Candidatus Hydrogenedentota bacterium]